MKIEMFKGKLLEDDILIMSKDELLEKQSFEESPIGRMCWMQVFTNLSGYPCIQPVKAGSKFARWSPNLEVIEESKNEESIPIIIFEDDGYIVNLNALDDSPFLTDEKGTCCGSGSSLAFSDDGETWYIFGDDPFSIDIDEDEQYYSKRVMDTVKKLKEQGVLFVLNYL